MPLKYMPLPKTQKLRSRMSCSGDLLMIEITEEMFIPGAKRWQEVMDVVENRQIMKLFMFFLSVCVDTASTVCLETLVSDEFDTIHNRDLNRMVHVLGYRIWVPLAGVGDIEKFGRGVTQTLSSNTAPPIERTTSHKRRRYLEQRLDVPVEDNKPEHLKSVKTFYELAKMVRGYFGGQGGVDNILPVGVDEGIDVYDDITTNTGAPRFSDFFSVERHFSTALFARRMDAMRMYEPQKSLARYIQVGADGSRHFFPEPSIRESGLLRCFRCGPGGFLEQKAEELMNYMLPHFTPTIEEAREKIERVHRAIGCVKDLRGLTLDELIRDGAEAGGDCFADPHDYSEITLEDTDMDDGDISESSYRRIINGRYHITTTLHTTNTQRFDYHSRKHSVTGMRCFMARLAGDIRLMLNGRTTEGIPKVYGNLYKESARLMVELNRTGFVDKHVSKARKIFYARASPDCRFTGLSWMFIRDIIGAAKNLKFMIQQQTVFILAYLLHFSATLNSNEVSSVTILAGPPDTGKTHSLKELSRCIANCLSRTEDSASEQAGTIDDSSDLLVVIQDEYKRTTDGTDAASTASIKNEQSRISNGVTIRRRFNRNKLTGKAEVELGIGIERTCFICGTNNVHTIPPAIISRGTVIPVVNANSRRHRDEIVDRMADGVASAIHGDPKVQKSMKAWRLASKVLSSLQIHYTALQAIGGIPPMREDCFQVFKLCRIDRFRDSEEGKSNRETTDLLRLATAIHIRHHLSIWYCRGLGAHFDYDKSIECLWYAWSNYLSMEEIVQATIQLKSTRNLRGYMDEVMCILKESIKVVNNDIMEVGGYWVTNFTKRAAVIRELKTRLPRVGDGLCEKIYGMLERSMTAGHPNIKMQAVAMLHGEFVLIHKNWIASVVTPVEAAIVQVLRRVRFENRVVFRKFDDESCNVYETSIRKSLRTPSGTDTVRHTELQTFKPEQIKIAFRQLECRLREDGTCMVETPTDGVLVAEFVPAATPHAERAEDGVRWKRSRRIHAPLVVHEDLFTSMGNTRNQTMTEMDVFFRDMLVIAGGYEGKWIFSGVDPVNPCDDVQDNHFCVRASDRVTFRLPNPHRQSHSEDCIIYGADYDDSDSDDDELASSSSVLFPPHKEWLDFNETSNVEKKVADIAHARIPLDPDIKTVFESAYSKYI